MKYSREGRSKGSLMEFERALLILNCANEEESDEKERDWGEKREGCGAGFVF